MSRLLSTCSKVVTTKWVVILTFGSNLQLQFVSEAEATQSESITRMGSANSLLRNGPLSNHFRMHNQLMRKVIILWLPYVKVKAGPMNRIANYLE